MKQLVTNSKNVQGVIDQQNRSKLRINIETLLIDINEELFAISEELAKIFQLDKSQVSALSSKLSASIRLDEHQIIQRYKSKQVSILKKVDCLNNEKVVKYLIQNQENGGNGAESGFEEVDASPGIAQYKPLR